MNKKGLSMVFYLLLIGIVAYIILYPNLFQTGSVFETGGNVYQTETFLISETPSSATYKLQYVYQSTRGGCNDVKSQRINLNVVSSEDRPAHLVSDLKVGESFPIRQVEFLGLSASSQICSDIPVSRGVEIQDRGGTCKVRDNGFNKVIMDCNIKATLYPLNSDGSRGGGVFHGGTGGSVLVTIDKDVVFIPVDNSNPDSGGNYVSVPPTDLNLFEKFWKWIKNILS